MAFHHTSIHPSIPPFIHPSFAAVHMVHIFKKETCFLFENVYIFGIFGPTQIVFIAQILKMKKESNNKKRRALHSYHSSLEWFHTSILRHLRNTQEFHQKQNIFGSSTKQTPNEGRDAKCLPRSFCHQSSVKMIVESHQLDDFILI